ncbi:MAG: hypothetical protein H6618_07290 [Deltaproteobacteria bacterium]|nr:hypothetical protein [Deltaproteobacteria bacterium]
MVFLDKKLTGLKRWGKLNPQNYEYSILTFQERQAGVSVVYDPDEQRYYYNAYCVETRQLIELFTTEYRFLDDALETVNAEFGTWDLVSLEQKNTGCGQCAAKK